LTFSSANRPASIRLAELHLLLGVQQGDLADLLQVVLDRVRCGTGRHDLLLGLVGVVGLRQVKPSSSAAPPRALPLQRLEGRLIDIVEGALLADGEDDLLTFQVDHHVSGQRLGIKSTSS
jgi:hypothetical protein